MTAIGGCTNAVDGEKKEAYPSHPINIMVPASAGGGFDGTARAMATVLTDTKASRGQPINVSNVTGGGGTVGLAQFVADGSPDPHRLLIMGLSLVGGIVTNKSPVGLDQVTPVASLTTDYEAIAVPTDSKYQTIQDLVADLKATPESIKWGVGARGGPDNIMAGLLAEASGISPAKLSLTEYSGGDAIKSLVAHKVTAIIAGPSDLKESASAGTLRVLAVSSETRLPSSTTPTLKESGINIVFSNWRGIVAPKGISSAQRASIEEMLKKMHDSDEWKDVLTSKGWTSAFQYGPTFDKFLTNEEDRVKKVLTYLGQAG